MTSSRTAIDASRRVLVVDDNRDATDILSILLTVKGHEVRTALDGGAALEVARDFAPEVTLLDLSLPVHDGFEVARRMREGPEAGLLVALTGHVDEETARRCLEAGFDHHLAKPITDVESFLRLILSAPRFPRPGA